MVSRLQPPTATGVEPANGTLIVPSLLAADYGRLAAEAIRAERNGAEWLHIDIMDGHFVPNLSFGPEVVRTIRKQTRLFLDVHLMCSRPEILIEPFARAGADQITVHVELGDRVAPLLWRTKAQGKRVGLAINPPTSMAQLTPHLAQVDLLLIMTVNPGFGGQAFIRESLPKIQQAYAWRADRQLDYRISVDGGIDFDTAADCAGAGADTFVSGTTLFGQRNLKAALHRMSKQVQRTALTTPITAVRG